MPADVPLYNFRFDKNSNIVVKTFQPTATDSFLTDIATICEDMPVDALLPLWEKEYFSCPTRD